MASKTLTPREIADSFKIRCSSIIDIMAEMGLTEKQEAELNELTNRFNGIGKPLTDVQNKKRLELFEKSKIVELPVGAKTYCKQWLKNFKYGRRKELKNKYVIKGNEVEEDGFTLMATELKLGMVYKNTERKSNAYIEGECDLHVERLDSVYDNKASYDLDTFPMYEDVFDKRYWWQLQGYGCLWSAKNLVLCHTLNDATDRMVEDATRWKDDHEEKYKIAEQIVFTQAQFEHCKLAMFSDSTLDTFIPIPDEERIKTFRFDYDPKQIEKVKDRVLMCREYIYQLLTN